MSSTDLSTLAASGMSLGDLISETVFNNENMAPAPVADAAEAANCATNETPTKTKKPRKTPVKKVKTVDGENGAEITPAKKPRKTPVKKENTLAKEAEDGAANAEEPTTPKAAAPKKRGPKKKVEPATPNGGDENGNVEMATPTTNGAAKSSVKKRGPSKAADGETPTKKSKAAAGETKRGAASKFPECWAEFTPEDKLIVNMRKEGKAWTEIEAAWTEITGRKPGTDVTRKRYTKLEAVAQEFKDEDLPMLCDFKKVVDDEIEVAIKKLKADAWVKIGERIKAAGGDDYKGPAIEKKFFWLKKNDKLTDSGDYIQPAVEDMENLSVEDDANGNVEAEAEGDAMEE